MDKQKSSTTDNNIRITAKILIEESSIEEVLYVCDLIALRGGGQSAQIDG